MTIKIRTWHKRLKEYVQPSKYAVIDQNGEIGNDDLVVEQFTGLHDDNGVEIYEGDIIKHREPLEEYERVIGAVVFDRKVFSGCPTFHVGDGEAYYGTSPTDEYVESFVVGNINENPELLD